MPRGNPEDLLRYSRPGEQLAVSDFIRRLPDRSENAVKAYVRRLVRAGKLRRIVGGKPTLNHPNRSAYELRDVGAYTPRKGTRADALLATIGPEDVVCTRSILDRFPDWSRVRVASLLLDLTDRGVLVRCGKLPTPGGGTDQWLYCLPGATAARNGYIAEDRPQAVKPVPIRGKRIPFVDLYTPPLPKFRIKSTRVLRPLSSPVEDAA